MSSPSCTTPSRPSLGRAAGLAAACAPAAAFAAAAVLLAACGGSRPTAERSYVREAAQEDSPDPANGQGVVTFHYSNKSTNADLQVDLGTTDIALEMTGKPPEAARAAAAERAKPETRPEAEGPKPPAALDGEEPEEKPAPRQARKPEPKPRPEKPLAAAQPEHLPEDPGEDAPAAQDVTDKVLLGIRKAQEFFYQKRYPEALDMVRSSLDARPTAEGHALAGSIHYMMGATGLARRHWQQALRLNPDMPAVVNMLDKIATPGGRGSPHPRPLAHRRAAAPSASVLEAAAPAAEAPYPEEFGEAAAPARPTANYRAPAPQAPASAPAAAPQPAPAPMPAPAAPESAAPPAPARSAPPPTPMSSAPSPLAPPPTPPEPAAEPDPVKPAAGDAADGPADPPAKPRFPQKAPSARKDKAP